MELFDRDTSIAIPVILATMLLTYALSRML